MAAFNKFNIFVQDLGRAIHDLNADTYNIVLTDAAPAATDTAYNGTTHVLTGSGAAEIAGGNGYTQGGAAVGSNAYTQAAGTGKMTGNAVPWTASGGAIAQFRYAVLVNVSKGTAGARPLVGWWDSGAEQNVASGNGFKIGKDASGNNWDSTTPILSVA